MSVSASVVITCYNLERYIGEAIRSALAQDGASAVEIIVVDDCSTDRSADIIRSLPVRYVRTPANSGVLLAMLQGIEAANGDIIGFLDGDDLWEPGKLASVLDVFEQDERCALVTHDLTFIDAEGRSMERTSRPSEVLNPLGPEIRSEKVREGILRLGDYVWLGSALAVRRSLGKVDEFDRWARELPDPANTYQDWPLAFWVASLADTNMAYLPQRLFRYRLHQANHSGDASTAARAVRNFTRTKNTLDAMLQLAEHRGLPEEIQNLVARRRHSTEYHRLLYQGRRAEALRLLPKVALEFQSNGQLFKEALRLAGILLLGPDRFARWASNGSMG